MDDHNVKQDDITSVVESDVDLDPAATSPNSARPSLRSWSEGGTTFANSLGSISRQVGAVPRKSSSDTQVAQVDKTGEGSGDPLGLKVLHTPSGQRRVDIVFVHGLGGSSRLSWSKNHDLDLFWPLKFLPFEPGINEARLLTFGYNANFGPGSRKNKMSVLDFAKDLLYDLKYAKDESGPELDELNMGEVCSDSMARTDRLANIDIATNNFHGSFYGRSHCERGIIQINPKV